MCTKINKEVRIRWDKDRSYVSVIREHYLRDDISCQSQVCVFCKKKEPPSNLLSECNHYVLPDGPSLAKYEEIFHHPDLMGIIVTETASFHVRTNVGRRAQKQLLKTMSQSSKYSIIFDNEHHCECFTAQNPDETLLQWQQRLTLRAAIWYSNHLDMSGTSHVNIILITDNIEAYHHICTMELDSSNITIMSVGEYLSIYLPMNYSILTLYESLLTKSDCKLRSNKKLYEEYLPFDALRKGIISGLYVSGNLQVSSYHPHTEAFVYLTQNRKSPTKILIHGEKNRNRSIHGDLVVVRLLPKSEWKGISKTLKVPGTTTSSDDSTHEVPSGMVVGVLSRYACNVVASFPEESRMSSNKVEKVLTIPYDVRIPKIRIATRLANQLKHYRIIVRIDVWDICSQYPDGHFIETIGPIGDIEAEIQTILIENQLLGMENFSQSILSEQPPPESWHVTDEEVQRRRDLRSSLIFSIDPQGCEDVDDTLSVRQLKNGGFEMGVHIADVSYFVPPNSHTDREAQERGTTIYLADRRYDMLPSVLSANLCSLLSNVDRYAVSVMWKLSPDYEVEKVWFGRTIIRSSYKLTYEVAQDIFDDKDALLHVPELCDLPAKEAHIKLAELKQAIKHLVDIARVLRKRRIAKGGLELEGVEVKVQIGDQHNIEELIPKQPMEMHETVAEWMIYANHWVAKKLFECLSTRALLRLHPPPVKEKFKQLIICASAKGFSMDIESNLSLAKSLDLAVDENDVYVNKVMRLLATQTMTQAEYFSTGSVESEHYFHYGLALDLYTHFTSPIRRYADLVVHRQLLTAVSGDQIDSLPDNTKLQVLCDHLNKKKRSSQLAQLASTKFFQSLYFLKEGRDEADAIVYCIKANGVLAFLPRYGIQGPVYLLDKNGCVLAPNETNNDCIFRHGTVTFTDHAITISYDGGDYSLRLFDHIRVRVLIQESRAHPQLFILRLLSCCPVHKDMSTQEQGKSELMKIVREEMEVSSESSVPCSNQLLEYQQRSNTLYALIQQMKSIRLNL